MPKRTLVLTVTYEEMNGFTYDEANRLAFAKWIKDRIESPYTARLGTSNFLVTHIGFGEQNRSTHRETAEQMPEHIGNLVTQFMHDLQKRRAPETDQDRTKS